MKKIILFVLIIIIAIIYNPINQKNVINKFYSANKKFSFISKLEDGNINIYEKKLFYKKKIKNKDKYKKILSVDNQGNVLYASISAKPHYASSGRIYFNDKN
jgi:AmiR/NasT family two-component response regulator